MDHHRKDERGSVNDATPKSSEPNHSVRPGASPATNDTPGFGGHPAPVPLLMWTDGLLFGGFSAEVQILNAAANARATVGRPSRSTLHRSLACFGNVAYAKAIRDTWGCFDRWGFRLGFVDRSRNADGKPVQLRQRSPQVDAAQTDPRLLIFVPTAPLRAIKGKGSLYAVVLFALYCREQRIRAGGFQLPDRIAAGMLRWPKTRVATARRRLIDAEAIQWERNGAGKGAAAVYTIPGAWKNNEPNLNPAHGGFDEAKTRTLHTLEVDSQTTLTVLARQAEADEAQRRIEWGGSKTRQKLQWVAEWLRLASPDDPFADVRCLLDGGPLAGITKDTATGTPGDAERGPLAIPNQEGSRYSTGTALPSVPHSPSLYGTATPSREGEREETRDDGEVVGCREAGSTHDWRGHLTAKAEAVYGASAAAVGTTTHRLLEGWLSGIMDHWDDAYGPLNEPQMAYASQRLAEALAFVGQLDPDKRYATLKRGVPFIHARNDDETRERLKALRSPIGEATLDDDSLTVDVSKELSEFLAA